MFVAGGVRVVRRTIPGEQGGGIGSWNDIGFTDPAEQQEYEDLTERLYRGVCTGILTAANAFRP